MDPIAEDNFRCVFMFVGDYYLINNLADIALYRAMKHIKCYHGREFTYEEIESVLFNNHIPYLPYQDSAVETTSLFEMSKCL